ncbi:helix-turn-helix domain-containing protein [Iamia sp.]|uniref:helix-turn-helix domain-containing protein n=1 Tax=Iamia sp. TaxID=2722710 RepID=UPI002C9230D8|nr:helix-turn-helix domain-containing protein [Iamia sp.]HXH56582.1 helix-turn-helix domain-containing protein [Iamia sp.]
MSEEEQATYDGQPVRRPFVMVDRAVGETILATLGGTCFGIWWHLLRRSKDGRCHPSLDDIAESCHLSRKHVTRCLDQLEEGGFITRKRRANSHNMSVNTEYQIAVTPNKRGCDIGVDIGVDIGHVQMSHELEPNKITREGPPTSSLRSDVDPPPEKKPRPALRLIPDDWEPTATAIEAAAEKHGMTLDEIAAKTERFRDWAASNGHRKADWDATWRNFMAPSRFDPPKPRASPNGQKPTHMDRLAEYSAYAAATQEDQS